MTKKELKKCIMFASMMQSLYAKNGITTPFLSMGSTIGNEEVGGSTPLVSSRENTA